MYVKDVVVQNQVGLYARPATYFIQKANEFQSSIWVEKEDRRVNAKSLLGILSLGIIGGTSIRIIADGMDEEEAVEQLVNLVATGFDSSAAVQDVAEAPFAKNATSTELPSSSDELSNTTLGESLFDSKESSGQVF